MKMKSATLNCNRYFSPCRADKSHRILFFPYAGGTGENFSPWFHRFPEEYDCIYALLPGRGRYFMEPPFEKIEELLDAITPEVVKLADTPFSLFGHSMGSLIAFELAQRLAERYAITPTALFLSGHRAPCLPYNRKFLHRLDNRELYQALVEMGGLDEKEGVTVEMLEPFFPTLKSDFKLCETYSYRERAPLPAEIALFWGREDPWIEREKMALWQRESTLPIKTHSFDGDHFYINEKRDELVDIVSHTLYHSLGLLQNYRS